MDDFLTLAAKESGVAAPRLVAELVHANNGQPCAANEMDFGQHHSLTLPSAGDNGKFAAGLVARHTRNAIGEARANPDTQRRLRSEAMDRAKAEAEAIGPDAFRRTGVLTRG